MGVPGLRSVAELSRPYRALLRGPQVAWLMIAALVARLPLGILSLALVLLVRDATGSYATAGAALSAYAIAGGALAPVQGRLVDRVGQTRVLVPMAFVHAAALAALVLAAENGAHAGALVSLAAVTGATTPPTSGAMRALWPSLVGRDERLHVAFALESVAVEAFFILGPLIAALVIWLASPAAAVTVAAALAVTGTLAFAAAPPSRQWRGEVRGTGFAGALAAPGIRTLLLSIVVIAGAFGVLEVALPAFAGEHGSSAAAGILLAMLAVGSMVGGLVYGARRRGGDPVSRYVWLAILFALGLVPVSLAGSIAVMAAVMMLAGLALAPLAATSYVLTDALAPVGTATEAFTWQSVAYVLGSSWGAAIAGSVVEGAGVSWALLTAAGCAAVGAFVAAAGRRTLEPMAATPAPERAAG
jgi:MFS family permease